MNSDTSQDSIFPSIVFWLCLFLAAGLFASVVLVPKLLVAERLAERHAEFERRLDKAQGRNQHLKQVVEAFGRDPEFAAEVARYDLGARAPGERRIAAEAQMAYQDFPSTKPVRRPRPPWLAVLEPFASDQRVRDAALFTAAGLIIAGFAFFPARSDEEE